MSNNHNRLAVSSEYSAVNYLPATLKTNKSGWLIEYYVENPQTQELSRKRIKLERLLNRYPSKSSMISHTMIVRFMDYVFYERKAPNGEDISAYTYNGYIRHGSTFFNWMIEKCYCKENHFSKIKRKKTKDKRRILIPEDYREKIDCYLKDMGKDRRLSP